MSDEQRANELIVKEQATSSDIAPVMSVEQVLTRRQFVIDVMKETMTEGVHYGMVPGCGKKPCLFKAGAELLSSVFRLCPKYEILEKSYDEKGHMTATLVCSLLDSKGRFLGQGIGEATTKESKHRYRNATRKCPKCGAETIFKDKKENGGWYCWAKKGGCGAKFQDGDPSIEAQELGKAENKDPADQYNTVIKMSKKRSHVDSVLTVLGVSDLFTQDAEDLADYLKNWDGGTAHEAPPKADKKKPTTQKGNGKGDQAPPSSPPPARQQTPPPEPPPAKNSGGNGNSQPGVFDDWTVEQCNAVCNKNPVLKMAITKAWNEAINTKKKYCEIFTRFGGDVEQILAYLQEDA